MIVYINLVPDTQVPDEILINRCVGRRLDPMTGKIYHIKNFPPETEEIKSRLVTRPDDTEEKVCNCNSSPLHPFSYHVYSFSLFVP